MWKMLGILLRIRPMPNIKPSDSEIWRNFAINPRAMGRGVGEVGEGREKAMSIVSPLERIGFSAVDGNLIASLKVYTTIGERNGGIAPSMKG